MLRMKLFRGFVVLVLLFSLLSLWVGVRTINRRIVDEAQSRVLLDLSSAWSVCNGRLREIESVLRIASMKQAVVEACREEAFEALELRNRMERIRVGFGLDFLGLVAPDGRVVMRTTPPYATGDSRIADPSVSKALKNAVNSGMVVLSASELDREAVGLAERAFLQIEDTARARLSTRREEQRGMCMVGAAPVEFGGQVVGVIYGGVLVNRNHEFIDRIYEVVYGSGEYKGASLGTATIFLHDARVATTVRHQNGNRALGTRVSKEVADRVLDNGQAWVGEAFVVKDMYLSAYDPIRDGRGEVIGMLYVGVLKQPFVDAARGLVLTYVYLSAFVLAVAVVLAFIMAGRLSAPIHRLVEASNRMTTGERPSPVETTGSCAETERLILAFNQMADTLAEREERLKALNRSYMETLGFVSHELKSPVASIINYVYLLKEQKLGMVNEKQSRALRAIDRGSTRLVEMVRHYLNLSRIENGEMTPVLTRLPLRSEVVGPVLESLEADIAEKRMRVENGIGAEIELRADLNMVREVFENLLSNAVKYGREEGRISLSAQPEGDWVRFRVRNDGEGVPEERIGELFQKFHRLHDDRDGRRQRGTGLGLFITRHIVELHGGSIGALSKPGEWVEFAFTLPAHGAGAGETAEGGRET